jgi:phosphatidylinositol N-acetylglucosaminyltransferase subunit Q
MFNEYFQLGNRIRKHYLSPGNFLRFVTGRFVPPIHRKNLYSLQYSMLPVRRSGIVELWELLMAEGLQVRKEAVGLNGSIKKPLPNGYIRRGR